MNASLNTRKIASSALAVVLWLITFGLGLEAIYVTKNLFSLIFLSLGGSLALIETVTLWLMPILGLLFLVFIIGTTEYHRQRIGQPASWRLFGWSLAVEVSIVLVYYIL